MLTAVTAELPTTAASGASRAGRMQSLLSSARRGGLDAAQAEDAAALLVSELAFKPLLTEMRKLPFGKTFIDGGRTEEIFGERLDECVSDIAARTTPALTADFARRLQPRPGADGLPVAGQDQASWTPAMATRPEGR